MKLLEIGLEIELFLLNKKNEILEPLLYGFPSDEMGFLIELRTHHSNTGKSVLESLKKNIEWNIKKAEKLGLRVDLVHHMKVSKEFQTYISTKYRHALFPDQTRNIYGIKGSHHTGLKDDFATTGMHVHFSGRNITDNNVELITLPIEAIVKRMDEEFESIIQETGRIMGEYELKSHGFEYRSLPATAFPSKVVRTSLDILKSLVE